MLQRLFLASVCAAWMLGPPATVDAKAQAADTKAAKTDKAKTADSASADKSLPAKNTLVKAGEISGKVTKLDSGDKTITIRVAAPNPDAIRSVADLNRQMQMQAFNGNAADRARQIANIQLQIAQQQQHLYKADGPEIVFQALDDVKIRMGQPPVQYDNKGNPRKLSGYELRALKGPGNLWGYPADFDTLKTDQIVTIIALKKKDAGKSSTAKPKPPDPNAKDATPQEPRYTAEVHIVKDTER